MVTTGDVVTVAVLAFGLAGTFLGGLYAGKATPYKKRNEARKAVKEAATAMLAYYQYLASNQVKAHERDLVGKLYQFSSRAADEFAAHEEGFSAITAIFKELAELINTRHHDVV